MINIYGNTVQEVGKPTNDTKMQCFVTIKTNFIK